MWSLSGKNVPTFDHYRGKAYILYLIEFSVVVPCVLLFLFRVHKKGPAPPSL